jgi:hypothetical protein
MLTEAWIGLDEGEIEEKDEYYQNRQTDIHEPILPLSYQMQIRCLLPKIVTH